MAISQDLLRLARESISEEFTHEKTEIDAELKKKYSDKKGAFVTLTIDGELRGCIGMIEPTMPLWQAIYEMAKSAAFSDPRFPALTYEELGEIQIEISVLTIPTLLNAKKSEDYIAQIKIGRDGLIIQRDRYKGLLLPQVFLECDRNLQKRSHLVQIPEHARKCADNHGLNAHFRRKVDALGALEMTCEKAGLDRNAWKQIEKTKVYKFQCEIIKE